MAFDTENTPTNNTLWCVRFIGCSGKGPTDAIFIHPVQMGEALYQGGWFSQLPGQLVQCFTGMAVITARLLFVHYVLQMMSTLCTCF